ncbi:MAG: VCBS repeat-containing protein, partial [Candidatus Methylomirabilis sp.]|nr:VCBS repeat-containing protein [Deltaproteobacteria bacterium]
MRRSSFVRLALRLACASALLPAAPARALEFQAATLYDMSASEPRELAVGDFNNDGHLDIVGTEQAGTGDDGVAVHLGDGTGDFSDLVAFGMGGYAWGVDAADFDGDGALDLVVTQGTQTKLGADPYCGAPIGSPVFLGNGHGAFAFSTCVAGGSFPIAPVARDLDGDGDADLAIAHNVSGGIAIFPGEGDGTFGAKTVVPGSYFQATDMLSADFNGDGKADLAAAHYSGVSVFLGAGDGTFALHGGVGGPYLTETVATGDFNGDGKADLVSVQLYARKMIVSLGTGDGGFTGGPVYDVGSFPREVAAGDFDQDGKTDLALAVQDADVVNVYLGLGDGRGLAAGDQPSTVALGDWNGDGRLDVAEVPVRRGDTAMLASILQV